MEDAAHLAVFLFESSLPLVSLLDARQVQFEAYDLFSASELAANTPLAGEFQPLLEELFVRTEKRLLQTPSL